MMIKQESKVKNFMNFMFEKVQPDYFEKNPDFYLTKNKENIKKEKKHTEENKKDEEKYIKTIKNINVKDIPIEYDKDYKMYILKIGETGVYIKKNYNANTWGFIKLDFDSEYNYKLILSIQNKRKENTFTWYNIKKELINPLFKNTEKYYGVYYFNGENFSMYLFLTKSKKEFSEKIIKLHIQRCSNNPKSIVIKKPVEEVKKTPKKKGK